MQMAAAHSTLTPSIPNKWDIFYLHNANICLLPENSIYEIIL